MAQRVISKLEREEGGSLQGKSLGGAYMGVVIHCLVERQGWAEGMEKDGKGNQAGQWEISVRDGVTTHTSLSWGCPWGALSAQGSLGSLCSC